MRKLHLNLQEQLQSFEMERKEISEAIIEVQKRIKILDDIMSWTLPEQPSDREHGQGKVPLAEVPLKDESLNGVHQGPDIEWINR